MNKWILSGIIFAALLGGLASGFLLSYQLVTKPIVRTYEKQMNKQNDLVLTMVKIPKNLIQNTLTVRRVKKGSSIYYVPSSDLQAIEVKMDSLVRDFTFPEDTVKPPGKTFWDKIKFW